MKITVDLRLLILIALVLSALKLCGVIAQSWTWVLAPIWIGVGLAVGVFALVSVMNAWRKP